MSASLVGSEMCIRDSRAPRPHRAIDVNCAECDWHAVVSFAETMVCQPPPSKRLRGRGTGR
eukprot:9776819-Alexandrium_andersonii.AAC.1